MRREVAAAMESALEDLGETEVRYEGERMSVNNVLYRLVLDLMHPTAKVDVEAYYKKRSALAEFEENDRFGVGMQDLCNLSKWVDGPRASDLFADDEYR